MKKSRFTEEQIAFAICRTTSNQRSNRETLPDDTY